MTLNRFAKKYLRRVRSMVPGSIRLKKKIMAQIQNEVSSYLEQNPDADDKALLCRFGEPETIAASYIETMGTAEILKKIRIRKWVMSAVAAVLAFIVLTWVTTITYVIIRSSNYDNGYTEVVINDVNVS